MAWGWCVGTDGAGYGSGRRLQSWQGLDEIEVLPGRAESPNRYVVGVGSAGQPDDGPALKYVLYETEQQRIRFHSI